MLLNGVFVFVVVVFVFVFFFLYNEQEDLIQQTRLELILVEELNLELEAELLGDLALLEQIDVERVRIGLLDHELILTQVRTLRVDHTELALHLDTSTVRIDASREYAHGHGHLMRHRRVAVEDLHWLAQAFHLAVFAHHWCSVTS